MPALNVRKIIITSRFGPLLLFALPFFVSMLFVNGVRSPVSVLISAVAGVVFGLLMSSKFRKNNDYFIENVRLDRYSVTKKYNKLFKQGKLPDSNDEWAAYLKHLDGLQKLYDRSVKGEYLSLAFLSAIFILLLVADHGLTVLNALFGLIIVLAAYGFRKSRQNLKKIDYLKNRIHTSS